MHPYHKGGREAFWHDQVEGFAGGDWPWGIVAWSERKSSAECVSVRDLTFAAMAQAVEMWNTNKRDAYFVGEAAYGHWLGWLRDVDCGQVDDPKAGMQGNGWCFDVLIHYRLIAGRWLKQKADDFQGEAAKQLGTAADHYAQIAELCLMDLSSPWDLTLGPSRYDEWSSELRQAQIARLEAARENDRAATRAIEATLQSLG